MEDSKHRQNRTRRQSLSDFERQAPETKKAAALRRDTRMSGDQPYPGMVWEIRHPLQTGGQDAKQADTSRCELITNGIVSGPEARSIFRKSPTSLDCANEPPKTNEPPGLSRRPTTIPFSNSALNRANPHPPASRRSESERCAAAHRRTAQKRQTPTSIMRISQAPPFDSACCRASSS